MGNFKSSVVIRNISILLTFSFLVMMHWGSCLGQRLGVYPCTDMKAIEWVRDPEHCDRYYICHFGQPLSMPACPKGQVWAKSAMNCVPIGSRWDDCFLGRKHQQHYDVSANNVFKMIQSTRPHKSIYPRKTVDNDKNRFTSPKYMSTRSKQEKKINMDIKRYKYVHSQLTTKLPSYIPRPTYSWEKERLFKSDRKSKPDNSFNQNRDFAETLSTPTPTVTTKTPARTLALLTTDTEKFQTYLKTKYGGWMTGKQLENVQKSVALEQQCLDKPGALLSHPEMCHWYYNCSMANLDLEGNNAEEGDFLEEDTQAGFMRLSPYRVRRAGLFVWECRYPQLYDDVTHKCREFINVDCGSRFEPVDQCEYSQRECQSNKCEPCDMRFGRCRGKTNGIYPIPASLWSPVFMTCYQSRNIAQDKCQPPSPIFHPDRLDCVSLFEVPKANGGLLPDCSTRPDGYYPDEQGRCAIFFRCALGQFRGFDECPPSTVFDPAIPACQSYGVATRPCGEGQAPLCGGKFDGLYADPYGRCTHFFQCRNGAFQRYYSCDNGVFDPLAQRCVLSAEQVLRPCGLQPNPCETLPSGVYPDQDTGCRNFIECHRGILITNGTCDRGRVFSAISGRCDSPDNTPPPCGVASTCLGRPDGRYPALSRGCSFYYECYHGEFISLRRCSEADGGFFFNPSTGRCDYPQNICPPCGYRWWGCAQNYKI